MSRIGKMPVTLPSGVSVTSEGGNITVTGPKGTLTQTALPEVSLTQNDGQVVLGRANDEAQAKARHGLMRALVQNMVIGVSEGFEKKLELNGVGFRVALAGRDLKFNLGYSHEVVYHLPEGVNAQIDQNIISISGISKQQVGQVAAEIRALRKPEPYKGKGLKYVDERILRKAGKSGKDK